MQITKEPQEDGKILVTFVHEGVTDTRLVDPIFDDKNEEDEELTSVRIQQIANGIQTKIEMGVITNKTIEKMNDQSVLTFADRPKEKPPEPMVTLNKDAE